MFPEIFKEEELDLDNVNSILDLPREIGIHPKTNEIVYASIGKFGPYLLHNKKYTSIDDPKLVFSLSLKDAIKLIESQPTRGGSNKNSW